ncbi:uncharacterized protein LOC142557711 [Dermacentor variabilis]|uniref:uncharacterized protein LOC142557711 n=1 Tax=Dermacentor variabilis TaxID=34621 RepID=UPI003F5B6139
MKEPRRGHSRRCRSVECRSENAGEEHLFRNPLSKWYRGRRRSKDDEAGLLDAEYDAGHESHSQQQVRGSQRLTAASNNSSLGGTPKSVTKPNKNSGNNCSLENSASSTTSPPLHKPTVATSSGYGPRVRISLPEEDLSTRAKQQRRAVTHQQQQVGCVDRSEAPAVPPRPTSCQPLQQPSKTRSLCPAERARLAFPGCHNQETMSSHSPSRVLTQSPARAMGVQSLDALLGQLCSGNCKISMKVKDKDGKVDKDKDIKVHKDDDSKALAHKSNDICCMKEATPCSQSHFPTSFPTSIEVLMTVNHSCTTHRSLSERSLQRDSSMVSVVHSKPGHQDIISIPKSRFIVVAALLTFVMVACFCITIYSFSVPAEHNHLHGNESTKSASPSQNVQSSSTSAITGNTTTVTIPAATSAAPRIVQAQYDALMQHQRTDSNGLSSRPRVVIL